MMFKFISFHTYCFHFFYAERVVLYTALYQYIHVRTITYARTTHTHDVSQDLTHVISFQFNHHPLVHTNLANCIALFALFFNISKPTKPNWLYQPNFSTCWLSCHKSRDRLSCRLFHCHGRLSCRRWDSIKLVFSSITDSNNKLNVTSFYTQPCHSNIRRIAVDIAPTKWRTRIIGYVYNRK